MDYYHLILEYLVDNHGLNKFVLLNPYLTELLGAKISDKSEQSIIWNDLDRIKRSNYIEPVSIPAFGKGAIDLRDNYISVKLLTAGEDYIKSRRQNQTEHDLLKRQTLSLEETNAINKPLSHSIITTNTAIKDASRATTQLYSRTETYYIIQAITAMAIVGLTITSTVNSCNANNTQKKNTETPQKILVILKEDTLILTDKPADTLKVPGHTFRAKKK